MIHFIQRNLAWMLLALLLSAALWSVVTTQQNPDVVDVFEKIPIQLRNVPANLTVRNEVQAVNLTVAAPRDAWPELRAAKLQASVDLSRVGPGPQEIPVEVTSIDPRVKIMEVQPPKAFVQLEPIRRKEVPARAQVQGEVPPGYLSRAPRLNPDVVAVTGPQSQVDQVVAAIAEVSLTGATSSINQVHRVQPLNAAGERVDRITTTPENVVVEVAIEQERAFKSVPIAVQLRGSTAPGYQVVGMRVDPTSLTIEGEPRAVESTQFVQTQPIDLNGASADVSVNAELQLPPGVGPAHRQPIVARVFVAAVEGSKTMDVAPTVQNVGAGMRATVSPAAVRLTLEGPMPLLNTLGPRDVRVTLNASGLGEGRHTLRPRIDGPPTVRIQRAEPEQLELQLNLAS